MNLFNFFNKHKNYILFNKNLIISGIFAFLQVQYLHNYIQNMIIIILEIHLLH
jgi:hypothetical protein